ncbi:ROK family protein [Streptomyces sp. NBC_01497]
MPVLEVGGTHVVAALVDFGGTTPRVEHGERHPLPADGGPEEIVDRIAGCARTLPGTPRGRWAVALPGPFDYEAGVARYEGVGKFDALHGLDLGRALMARLPGATGITFVNDAVAFALGEAAYGAAVGHGRSVAITLGTGVGSAFLSGGRPVSEGALVPPQGRADLIRCDGLPLEDGVSRRAVIRAYRAATGRERDVREIAALARRGDTAATRVVTDAFGLLGRALGPWLARFRATVVVVGGSMTGSWDVLGPAVRDGVRAGAPQAAGIPWVTARLGADAPLLGAALSGGAPHDAWPPGTASRVATPPAGPPPPASPAPLRGETG